MLTELFGRKTCAECKWCCSFDKNDQWETPLIISENVAKLQQRFPDAQFTPMGKDYKLDLSEKFQTDNPKEYVFCPFLDQQSGCVLSEEEKPFDCKIWPFRLMRKEGQLVLTLTPTCPACNALPMETIKSFAEREIAEVIERYAVLHPDMILPYRSDYPIVVCYCSGKPRGVKSL